MGRPKEHGDATGEALLDAAERLVDRDGLAALSVRRVAEEAATTTRAVYAVFGSKEGLIVALGSRAFHWLTQALDDLPNSHDAVEDLVEAGVRVFRRLVVDHPALFKVGVQHIDVPADLAAQFRAEAERAMRRLHARLQRLRDEHLLGDRDVRDAATQFHALCEGLAAIELRGILTPARTRAGKTRPGPCVEERIWRDALTALITGFGAAPAAER